MKNGEIKIETGVALPPRTRKPKYPWADMEVGHSIFLADKKTLQAASSAKKATGNKFEARYVEGGVRVWRTE